MPMYEELKFPASAMMMTIEMIKIATFDLVPTELIDDLLWYFPEAEAFNLSFETTGVESEIFLQNTGLIFYLIFANIVYGILHFLLLPTRKLGKFFFNLVAKMQGYLYFNGSIRFYMEVFLDVALLASLNLHTVEWDSPFPSINVSNYLSIAALAFVCILPLCFILLACCRPGIWKGDRF